MPRRTIEATRAQVLAFRRRSSGLDERLPAGRRSLEAAASAGLQDSMPRAAVLSLHARVEGIESDSWDDPEVRREFNELADLLETFLDGRRMSANEAAKGIGLKHPNGLRYAAPTGR